MLQITKDNCHKFNLETIIDPNNSQHFWINRRDAEIERNLTGKLFSMSIKTIESKI